MSCFGCRESIHSSHQTLLQDVQQMTQKLEQVILKFGYRKVNGVADFMAKKGSTLHLSEKNFFEQVDDEFKHIMYKHLTTTFKRCTTKLCMNSVMLKYYKKTKEN